MNFQTYFEAKKPKTPVAYDFGGGEGPCDEDSTVVDIISEQSFRNDGYTNPYIQTDLNNYIKLPPVKSIFTNQTVKYIRNLKNLAQTISTALLPGGVIDISGSYANDWRNSYILAKFLQTTYGFKLTQEDNRWSDPDFQKFLKSISFIDPTMITAKQAKLIDDNDHWAGMGEFQLQLQK